MKKITGTIAVALLLTTLAACGNNNQNNDTPKLTALDYLNKALTLGKAGYNLESSYEAKQGEKLSKGLVDSGHKNDIFYYKFYTPVSGDKTPSKDGKYQFETIRKGQNDNFAYTARLNVNNELSTFKLLDPTWTEGSNKTQFFEFSPYYANFFSSLSGDNFTQEVTDGTYDLFTLNLDASLDSFKPLFTTQMYGNPGFNVKDIQFKLVDNKLSTITSTLTAGEGATLIEYKFTSNVIALGEEAILHNNAETLPEVQDQVFVDMLNELKAGNFVANVYQNLATTPSATLRVNATGISYDYQDDFGGKYTQNYLVKEGKLHEVKEINGILSDVGVTSEYATVEEAYKTILPTFAMSRAVFDKVADTEGKYVLKKEVKTGDIGVVNKIGVNEAEELSDFVITISKNATGGNKYTFSNTIKGNKKDKNTTVVFENVGSTTLPYDASIPTANIAKNLFEAIEPTALATVTAILDETTLKELPAPLDLTNAGTFIDVFAEEPAYKGIMCCLTDGVSLFDETRLLSTLESLLTLGFNESTTTPILNANAGFVVSKSINGKNIYLEFNQDVYDPIFVLGIYTDEALAL